MSTFKLLAKAKADIDKYGWSAIAVFPGSPDDPPTQFTYSIGFRDLGHPEIIVVGLPLEQAHGIIASVYEQVAAGAKFADGDRSDDVLQGFVAEFRALPADGEPANLARAYYGVDELPVLQLAWPDAAGRLPFEEGCEEGVEIAQDLKMARVKQPWRY